MKAQLMFLTDDICYYRVKAIVTGKPSPTVKFSKDDSGGVFGVQRKHRLISTGVKLIL